MPVLNSESYFSELPKLNTERSIFHMPFEHKTSFDVGQVIPLACVEVLPGDTFKVKTSIVARLQTLLTPIMDNVNLELSAWFVPMAQIFDKTKQFFGENTEGPWTMDKINYRIPYLQYPDDEYTSPENPGWQEGTLADYMGVPLKVNLNTVPGVSDANFPSVLPFRGYAKIINEFWRDQNLQDPVVIHTDEVIRKGSNGDNYITDLELGGKPFIAARYHDMFSSSLPAPQKSESVSIFGNFINEPMLAPVGSINKTHGAIGSGISAYNTLYTSSGTSAVLKSDANSDAIFAANDGYGTYPTNMWANINVPQATITQLRLAFQLQRYFERSATSGTRYREYIQEFFGCSNGDLRMFVPEYLGGKRIPLSIHQVANTAQSDGADLGDLGAMSNTSDVDDLFYHSFTEFGYLYVLGVVRFPNTYSQGLEKMWSRREPLEFYNPVFARLGQLPIYKRQIFLEGTDADAANHADEVWGYNEAWCEYRQIPSRVSSSMRPEAAQSLASWHLADDYSETPYLGADWLKTNKGTVDRVLAYTSDVVNQVFCDFYMDIEATRPMPVHSVPGFADHF